MDGVGWGATSSEELSLTAPYFLLRIVEGERIVELIWIRIPLLAIAS